jgi:PleD family two-component response regulator
MVSQQQPPSLHREERTAPLMILVVSPDHTQLKLLTMALQIEWACEVFSFDNARHAEERAKALAPDLVILDALLLDGAAHDLSDRLRRITGRGNLPTLLINAPAACQSDYTLSLMRSWKMHALYAAIRQLLGLTAS